MMKMIYGHNVEKALRELAELGMGRILAAEVSRAVSVQADRIREGAERRAPVVTGALKASIRKKFRKGSLWAKVEADYPKTGRQRKRKTCKQKTGSREYYAFAVEFGTKRSRARPFLMPAAEAEVSRGVAEVEAAMERVLNRAHGRA